MTLCWLLMATWMGALPSASWQETRTEGSERQTEPQLTWVGGVSHSSGGRRPMLQRERWLQKRLHGLTEH